MNRRGFLKFLPMAIPSLGLASITPKPETIVTQDFSQKYCPCCGFAMWLGSDTDQYSIHNRWWECPNDNLMGKVCPNARVRYKVGTVELERL
jgi:hypothetical protein